MTTIGKGGFGKAKLTTYNGKSAVVKYLNVNADPRATLATCTVNRNSAQKEGEIMKLFKNKENIAEIYSIVGHAIYMKYYPLGSLRNLIDKGQVDYNRYFILYGISLGLKDIHDLGFVHSDIKASNILCEESYKDNKKYINACISDFGGAQKKGSTLSCLTFGYVPPETLTSGILSYETDIFALGKLLLELFTKKSQSDVAKINYDNFSIYANINDFSNNYQDKNFTTSYSVKNELYNFVRNCLNPSPEKRPSLNDFISFGGRNYKLG